MSESRIEHSRGTGGNKDRGEARALAKLLPEYFNAQGLRDMARDLEQDTLFVTRDEEKLAGFLTLRVKNEAVAEITWMAVHPDRRGQGLGTRLVDHVASWSRDRGFSLIEVKTLAPSVDYPPYELTRGFYEKNGFVPLEEIDPYPPWGGGNPCLISVRVLR